MNLLLYPYLWLFKPQRRNDAPTHLLSPSSPPSSCFPMPAAMAPKLRLCEPEEMVLNTSQGARGRGRRGRGPRSHATHDPAAHEGIFNHDFVVNIRSRICNHMELPLSFCVAMA